MSDGLSRVFRTWSLRAPDRRPPARSDEHLDRTLENLRQWEDLRVNALASRAALDPGPVDPVQRKEWAHVWVYGTPEEHAFLIATGWLRVETGDHRFPVMWRDPGGSGWCNLCSHCVTDSCATGIAAARRRMSGCWCGVWGMEELS